MRVINRMEHKYGKYAIYDLTAIIIGCYVAGYLLQLLPFNVMDIFTLNPALILKGQVWRLITWILQPPQDLGFFAVVMLLLCYSLGKVLEHKWGSFRFSLYIYLGLFATVMSKFFLYFMGVSNLGVLFNVHYIGTNYINISIVLAAAVLYPEMQLRPRFLIPIKFKWLGFGYGAIVIFDFIRFSWSGRVAIVASLCNFILLILFKRIKWKGFVHEIRKKC